MTDTKTTTQTTATPGVAPAPHDPAELLKRQRENARRALLKRRQRKSNQ